MPQTSRALAPALLASVSPGASGADRSSEIVPGSLRVVVLPGPGSLLSYQRQWAELAEAAAEPNVFYEPCVLGPALASFGHRHALKVVVVLADRAAGGGDESPLLLGLFPLERQPPSAYLPLPHLALWVHDYLYVPVPLVHRDHAGPVLGAFFDWLEAQKGAAGLLSIEKLPVGGPFHQLLVQELGRRRAVMHVSDRYVRAVMAPRCDGETYQARALAGKHRKEFRRRKKRLGEAGPLRFWAVEPGVPADIEAFIHDFLSLEAGGWKGQGGSALASEARDARFFAEMIRQSHQAGRLEATVMEVAGRPLAMQTLLRSGDTSYAFKMAYDEAYARYSPGVLLVLDLVERVAASPRPQLIDSAAERDHPMVNQLFTERRNIESLLVAVGSTSGLLLSLLPALRWAKRAMVQAMANRRPPGSPPPQPQIPG